MTSLVSNNGPWSSIKLTSIRMPDHIISTITIVAYHRAEFKPGLVRRSCISSLKIRYTSQNKISGNIYKNMYIPQATSIFRSLSKRNKILTKCKTTGVVVNYSSIVW